MFLLAMFTLGLSAFVFMFIYNKLYVKDLISSGFKVKAVASGTIEQVSAKMGINLPVLQAA